jgi:hypothetical protein
MRPTIETRQIHNAMIDDRALAFACATDLADEAGVAGIGVPDPRTENGSHMNMKHMTARIAALILTVMLALSAELTGVAATTAGFPTGETVHGQTAVEPAYNDVDGSLVFLLTPVKAPPPHANASAVGRLLLVEYPPNTVFDVPFNCQGVPGNCPDHDGLVAIVATTNQPAVYGTDPAALPGHDHLVAPPGTPDDFAVAREVIEVLFTPQALADNAITHLTTEAEVDAAVARGDAVEIDLGFALHFSVVSGAAYDAGTPIR